MWLQCLCDTLLQVYPPLKPLKPIRIRPWTYSVGWGSSITWSTDLLVPKLHETILRKVSQEQTAECQAQIMKMNRVAFLSEMGKMLISYGNSKQLFNKILPVTGSIQWFWFTYGITVVAHQISLLVSLSNTISIQLHAWQSRSESRDPHQVGWLDWVKMSCVLYILLNFGGMDAKTRNSYNMLESNGWFENIWEMMETGTKCIIHLKYIIYIYIQCVLSP